jgi:RNA polymerase sigma-70 factor (ECF subfamily)
MVSKGPFESQVMGHWTAAYNLAYWLLQDREEAEDVVQDAYLRAFQAYPAFKGENVKTWLLVIVRNTAFNALKRRKRRGRLVSLAEDLPLLQVASEDPLPDTLIISEADRELLLRALAELPVTYRDVIVLRDIENLSYAEIAEVVGLPPGTVMSRLSRGRAQLRKAVLRWMAENEPDAV